MAKKVVLEKSEERKKIHPIVLQIVRDNKDKKPYFIYGEIFRFIGESEDIQYGQNEKKLDDIQEQGFIPHVLKYLEETYPESVKKVNETGDMYTAKLENLSDRSKVFEKELSWIKNDDLREFAIKILEIVPDYFFFIPASSTGKYHPNYTLGNGGLVKHTKAAMGIAKHLFTIKNLKPRHEDIALITLLAHDTVKNGFKKSRYTTKNHPELAAALIKEKLSDSIDPKELEMMCHGIECHMGQWGKIVPDDGFSKFIHICDYLASRKSIEYNFEVE